MELETITKVPVERLRLDRRNPRLHGENEKASDEELVAWLNRAAALGELLQSISANGYIDIEPLIVMGGPAPAMMSWWCWKATGGLRRCDCCANRNLPAG